MRATNITQQLLRDGDPRALATLCEARGRAVYAYCLHVAGDAQAMEAAANAFADFRLAALAEGDLTEREAEALLRRMTRRAAARRGVNVVAARTRDPHPGACDGQEIRLVRYAEGSLAPAVSQVFAAHVAQCHMCGKALARLQAGEHAIERPPKAALPLRVTDEILWAMALAAPVQACDGNAALVQREALRLLTSRADPADAAPVSTSAPRPLEARPERSPAEPGRDDRPRRRFGWRDALPKSTHGMATWGAAFAGAAGAAFGIGLVLLTEDDTVSPRPPTGIAGIAAAATPQVSTTARSGTNASPANSSAGKLRIEVVTTTVHPVPGGTGPAARVSVHVRITNDMALPARARRPVLYVGDTRVDLATVSSTTATSPIAPLAPGAVAEGRLRFETEQPLADQLTTARVRLRISGRSIPLQPVTAPT